MPTVFELKEQALAETPLLLFECELRNGQTERWSTHRVSAGGSTYEARVLRHNLFELETSSELGVDVIPRISVTLANADSHFSQIERAVGWKGAKVTVRFLFFDLRQGTAATETRTLFQGMANPPEEITEASFRLTAINRMNMQRVLLPQVRIQRRCPWGFPANLEQRQEAVHGGGGGPYSRFFRCGYSADVEGGMGNLNAGAAFTSCNYTRADCEARGMFSQDSAQRPTRRFGGIEFVPSSILVRSYGERGWHASAVVENEARYNDFVPLVYGTAWYAPPIVFARNDGNLTHMQVLLGMGEMQDVLKVLVNDIEIPLAQAGANMTGTGWFGVASLGNRTGNFDPDFTGGDPHGSMAYLSVVVPNRINDGRSLPRIKVLAQGLKLAQFGSDGAYISDQFTNNPAWVLLDVLRRGGWRLSEIDVASFAQTAAYCAQEIQSQDLHGNPIQLPRFQCNLVLQRRRSAGDTLRGVRNGSRLYLTYGTGGLLQLRVENTFALQQPVKPEGSNSTQTLDGGWPSYEFGDGASGSSGILRRENGDPSIVVWSKSTADTPNRFAVEFQDALNEYQQDSFSLVDVEDVSRTGQEITGPASVLGMPNYDQAARILKFNLDKAIQGNTYVEFESSVKALGLRPGDLISLTYLKEGFQRQPFRVLRVAPGANYRTVTITAQIHKDAWYSDTNGQLSGELGAGRQPGAGVGLPRPLLGNTVDANGEIQFEISESAQDTADGAVTLEVTAGFLVPAAPQKGGPGIPLLSLAPAIGSGGTLAGDQTLYYSVSAVDAAGQESALSFLVRAAIPQGPATNSVTLSGLSFSAETTGFHVYRGANPAQLFRIASNRAVANSFTDTGLTKELAAPPDANYDHANFYWRMELQPEYAAAIHGANSVGNSALQMAANAYRGMTVRITRGKGAGQERAVVSNTAMTLSLGGNWDVEPDATSMFVVAEAGWHFGAMTRTSPVQFEIPNRTGAIVHISGRAANVNDAESAPDLATLTRWAIGGAGGGDEDVPPRPSFGLGLSSAEPGTIELSGIGFDNLTNTRTITAASLTLHYWDELAGATQFSLAAAIGTTDTFVDLNAAGSGAPGSFLQMDAEVMRVEAVLNGGLRYSVTRGLDGTAASHAAQAAVYHLARQAAVAPLPRDFFGSPFSGHWSFPIPLPNARVAAGELFVTNTKGNSESRVIALTGTVDKGLRTMAGGQFSIQIEGFLAVQNGAAPDLIVEAAHSVRDVYAVVRQAPAGAAVEAQLKRNGILYCTLTIPSGATMSNVVDGFPLAALAAGARISVDITSVGQTDPGADLTVILRL